MTRMQKFAQLVITSYDNKKITKGYNTILSTKKNLGLVIGKPIQQKVKLTQKDPPIWGCKGTDLKRVTVSVSGSLDELTKLLALKTIEGVYMQLLLKEKI